MYILLFISGPEIIFIVFIVLMLFGADKVPEIARGLGKGFRQLRDITNDVKREITQAGKQHDIDTRIVPDINKEIRQITKEVDEVKESVTRNIKS